MRGAIAVGQAEAIPDDGDGPGYDEVVAELRSLEQWLRTRSWCGPDPYDGPSATRFVRHIQGTRISRRIATQVVKRSPINLRPLLGIQPGVSAVTLAHYLSAVSRSGFDPEEVQIERASAAAARLASLATPDCNAAGWGYHFDVQTRLLRYPAGQPNTIATSFAGLALVDCYQRWGAEQWLELASKAADFIIARVPQTEAAVGAYFGYLPGDRTPIHNANMLASVLLAQVGQLTARSDLLGRAEAGVRYTLSHQRPDGSWRYGETCNSGWIDGFHTGYVLDALMGCAASGVVANPRSAIQAGLRFYWQNLFCADGTAKYYHDSTYPIDGQSVAQGIQTFARAEDWLGGAVHRSRLIFGFALRRMRASGGAFVFQRRRLWTNCTAHPRWVMAPMMAALARLERALKEI